MGFILFTMYLKLKQKRSIHAVQSAGIDYYTESCNYIVYKVLH